jgi:two-component system, NtrC family, sensor kinase
MRASRHLARLTAPANQVRLLWAVRIRWLVIVGFFALAVIAWTGGALTSIAPCAVAAAGAALVNGVNHWSVARLRHVHVVTAAAIAGDVLLITALVILTGGVLSPFVMLYVVQVVATAMLVGFVPALASAVFSALTCAVALWAVPPGFAATVLHLALPPVASWSYQVVWIAFLLYCLSLLAFLGGYIANRLRRSERDLAHSTVRMGRALSSLRVAHADLAATYERLRATEAQLVHDEKMRALGLFVAGIAHELNNPIAVVAGNIDHLAERLIPLHPVLAAHAASATQAARNDDERESHRRAQRQAIFVDELPGLLHDCLEGMRRAGEIVKSLHAFSRSGATDTFQLADVHAMLDRTLTLVRHRAGSAVVVERAYGDVPQVECLPSQLDQVFLNLLLNAADAVGGTGTITVSTRLVMGSETAPAQVAVSIRDSGAGVASDILPHIFDPFFTTKPVGKGAGLGLSVSYGIVARHGGTITVQSPVGEGATFTVLLPTTRKSSDQTRLHDPTLDPLTPGSLDPSPSA